MPYPITSISLDKADGDALALRVNVTYLLTAELQAVLIAISGQLNGEDVQPGWVEFRDWHDDDPSPRGTPSIRYSQVTALVDMGLMEGNTDAYHVTYRITRKGKQVVALLAAKQP